MSSEVPVEIEIDASKTKWVRFAPDNEYTFKLAETANVGYKVGRLRLNSVAKSTFTVLPPSDQSNIVEFPFSLDVNGTISVVNLLDYEKRRDYSFHVGVTVENSVVHSSIALVHVKIEDFNDNAPKFFAPQLQLSVFEDAPVGTSVIVLSADDADSNSAATSSLRYTIGETADQHLFKIDPHSGWILTTKTLDREIKVCSILICFTRFL